MTCVVRPPCRTSWDSPKNSTMEAPKNIIVMEEKCHVTFNITGGNNQILPNATHAVQYFYGYRRDGTALEADDPESVECRPLNDKEKALLPYFNEQERLRHYAARLYQCTTAGDIGRVVVDMRQDAAVRLDGDEAVKERFISVLVALAPHLTTGKTVSNVRQRIIDAWNRRRR